jgi:hypothetical protein
MTREDALAFAAEWALAWNDLAVPFLASKRATMKIFLRLKWRVTKKSGSVTP